jgi:hypothetical protein
MVRLLLLLVGTLTANRTRQWEAARCRPGDSYAGEDPDTLYPEPGNSASGGAVPPHPRPLTSWPAQPSDGPGRLPRGALGNGAGPHRRRVPRWVRWTAGGLVVGLIFRKAIAAVALMALSAAFHLVGVNVHLPNIRFAWPWQTVRAGTTTTTDLGPWVLQKIEGISMPALGRANFSFFFTHKVSKSVGPLPCWYASTFYAVGHASASVDLNPGPSWWTTASGHYQLQVLSRPAQGKPGHVSVTMVLPPPRLPQSVHDVTIDNIPSRPIDTQHSWTYPGLGCGVLLRPQFPESVLYSQAQHIAFYKSTHVPQVTTALIRSAETEAAHTIGDNFIQPTVNALGYTLDRFTLHWATAPR